MEPRMDTILSVGLSLVLAYFLDLFLKRYFRAFPGRSWFFSYLLLAVFGILLGFFLYQLFPGQLLLSEVIVGASIFYTVYNMLLKIF